MKKDYSSTLKTAVLSFVILLANAAAAQNWDANLLEQINPNNPSSDYWKITSSSAYWVPASGILATYFAGAFGKNKMLKKEGYKALFGIAVSTALSEAVKFVINRQRPAFAFPNDIFEGSNTGIQGQSFPSGHTTLAFTYATLLTMQYHKWYVTVPAFLWAGSVAYSRMYMGKHYPTDVLAAAVLGTASTWLTYKLNNKLFKVRPAVKHT